MLSIIVALAPNNAIGCRQQLLWNISEDLRYFKRVTTGHTVLMGRNTFLSIGRPLPNRRNIVLSDTYLDPVPGIEIAASLPEAISLASHSAPDNTSHPATDSALRPAPGSTVHSAPENALCPASDSALRPAPDREIFVIGGGEVYRQTLPLAGRLYITHVKAPAPQADTFFPTIDWRQWKEISREDHPHGASFPHPFSFVVYARTLLQHNYNIDPFTIY